MKNFLEDLWFSFEIEKRTVLSDSERGIVNSSSESRKKIYDTLTPEQKADFDSYEELSNEICLIYEKEIHRRLFSRGYQVARYNI